MIQVFLAIHRWLLVILLIPGALLVAALTTIPDNFPTIAEPTSGEDINKNPISLVSVDGDLVDGLSEVVNAKFRDQAKVRDQAARTTGLGQHDTREGEQRKEDVQFAEKNDLNTAVVSPGIRVREKNHEDEKKQEEKENKDEGGEVGFFSFWGVR